MDAASTPTQTLLAPFCVDRKRQCHRAHKLRARSIKNSNRPIAKSNSTSKRTSTLAILLNERPSMNPLTIRQLRNTQTPIFKDLLEMKRLEPRAGDKQTRRRTARFIWNARRAGREFDTFAFGATDLTTTDGTNFARTCKKLLQRWIRIHNHAELMRRSLSHSK